MIKKIILFTCLILVPLSMQAKPFYSNVYEAQKQALREAKLMLFFVVTDTCPYCHKLMDDVLNNKSFMKFLDEKMVVAVSDLNNGGILPEDLRFNGVTPTTYLITPTGNVIGNPIEGAIDSDMLHKLLLGLEEYKRNQLGF